MQVHYVFTATLSKRLLSFSLLALCLITRSTMCRHSPHAAEEMALVGGVALSGTLSLRSDFSVL